MPSSTLPTVVLTSPPRSVYALVFDPPLPRFIAWVPVLCRGLAVFIIVPFIIVILLDIVAYLIARTLHLRPHIMRVPRSPPSGSNINIAHPKGSPSTASEILPPVSEGELSPVLTMKKLEGGSGRRDQRAEGPGLGASGVDEAGQVVSSGLGLEVEEPSVFVRPATPDQHRPTLTGQIEPEKITTEQITTEQITTEQITTEEPRQVVTLGAPIAEGSRNAHVVSPTPTLLDELETDARYGIDARAESPKLDNTDDLADDALAGWTGSKGPVAERYAADPAVDVAMEPKKDEGGGSTGQVAGFEPIKGGAGEPAVHLGEWQPTDFIDRFKGQDGADGETDEALKNLGEALAEEDARAEPAADEEEMKGDLTIDELKDLLRRALEQKVEGNALFQQAEPDLDGAIGSYRSALDLLPITSLSPSPEPIPTRDVKKPVGDENAVPNESGVMELTDEQAETIKLADEARRAEVQRKEEEERDPVVRAKREVEREIEETKKAVWGNLGAVWMRKGDDKEAVTACTEALKLDGNYVKALHRRALASERIGSWSSLSTAQEDYTKLTQVLPTSSPIYQQAQRSLATLPNRIRLQQEKEKDEMLSKLKDLGDGLLGRFGLSTNNFKFDKQEGGGYSMRFER